MYLHHTSKWYKSYFIKNWPHFSLNFFKCRVFQKLVLACKSCNSTKRKQLPYISPFWIGLWLPTSGLMKILCLNRDRKKGSSLLLRRKPLFLFFFLLLFLCFIVVFPAPNKRILREPLDARTSIRTQLIQDFFSPDTLLLTFAAAFLSLGHGIPSSLQILAA